MSEEQDRPLTRRELRERERLQSANSDDAAGGAPDEQSIVEEPPPARLPEPPTGAIPLIGPDGKPRSRREMRELWAAEQERLEADSGGAPVADEVTETELDSAEEAAAQAAERALSDSHLLDTQAMSLDELAGAERAAEDEPSAPDAPREHA
ncbi:hypothetical protein OOT08_15650, partial [Leucobacter sp. M11]|nr:hypothetical protein [Leucobacter sp. M11]